MKAQQKMAHPKEGDARNRIEESWRRLQAFDQNAPDRLGPDFPRFIDYAWKKFEPKSVLTILMSEQPTYKALKPILFSGLCTWVVCPKRPSLRQHGMLLVGIKHMRAAEAMGRAAFANPELPNHDLLGDTIGRLRGLGQDFYSDFYYPIGGLAQVLRSSTPGQFAKSLATHTKNVGIVVAMLEIFDFHAKHLNDTEKYYQASDSKGFELIRAIHGVRRGKIGIDLGKISDVWKGLGETSAMIYAASTILAGETETLLDVICAGEANYKQDGHLLRTWIGRARYVAETILNKSTKPELGRANASQLPDLPSEPTPEPHFDQTERGQIEAEFDKAAILSNRRPGERRTRLSRRGPRKV